MSKTKHYRSKTSKKNPKSRKNRTRRHFSSSKKNNRFLANLSSLKIFGNSKSLRFAGGSRISKIARSLRSSKSLKFAGGPNTPISSTEPLPCCMCGNKFQRDTMMTPVRCLQKYGEQAHKICQECWWDPETGFARENAPHGCPGCTHKQPINPPLITIPPRADEIIDITDD